MLKSLFFCHSVRSKLSRTAAEPPGRCDEQRVGGAFHYCSSQDMMASSIKVVEDCEDATLLTARGETRFAAITSNRSVPYPLASVCIVSFCVHLNPW